MRPSTRALIAAMALLALRALPAAAQLSQYTAPGALTPESGATKDALDREIEEARWNLGPLRLSPVLALRDAAYVSNVFAGTTADEPDFTVTLGAGLRGYLPLGPKAYLALDALPQYVWWQDQAERRRLNGDYGGSLYGFLNRLTTEATLRRVEEQTFVTPEFEQRIHTRQERLGAAFELDLASAFSMFVSAHRIETRNLLDDDELADPRIPAFEQLDREERVARAGVEYRFPGKLSVAAGVERTETDFLDPTRDRSSSGTDPVVEVEYDGTKLQAQAAVARRSLEPEEGSELAPYEETNGQFQLTLTPRWRLSYTLYGTRTLVYSLQPGYSHFTSDRLGLSVAAKLSERGSMLTLFGEQGLHDYEPVPGVLLPVGPTRQDDFSALGTSLRLQVRERLLFSVGVVRTEIDSALPGFDRELTYATASVEIRAFGGQISIR